jgi:hypothetical protein
MHGLQTLAVLNELACLQKINHPRLHSLTHLVQRMSCRNSYRAALLRSIERYGYQLIDRPYYRHDEGLDDLEALCQVTLGDMLEASIQELGRRKER